VSTGSSPRPFGAESEVAKKQIVADSGRSVVADNAVPLLADAVGTIDDAMNALIGSNGRAQ